MLQFITLSSNGRTTVSEAVNRGSSPCEVAKFNRKVGLQTLQSFDILITEVILMSNKICKKCDAEKPREAFYKMSSPKFKESWDCRDSYCIPCRKEYGRIRRKDIRQQCFEYLGGKCLHCGLVDEILELYDKEFTFGKVGRSFESLKPELDKCDLLCVLCHRREHFNRKVGLRASSL